MIQNHAVEECIEQNQSHWHIIIISALLNGLLIIVITGELFDRIACVFQPKNWSIHVKSKFIFVIFKDYYGLLFMDARELETVQNNFKSFR